VSPDVEPLVAAIHAALPLLRAARLPLVVPPEPPVDKPVTHPVDFNFNHMLYTVPTTRSFDYVAAVRRLDEGEAVLMAVKLVGDLLKCRTYLLMGRTYLS
jgi:hypothetical protein